LPGEVLVLVTVTLAVLVAELPELMAAAQTLALVDHKAQAVLVEILKGELLMDRHCKGALQALLVMAAAEAGVVAAIGVEAQVLTEIVLRVTLAGVVVLATTILQQLQLPP
jgi:hypothetical protein